VLGCARVGAGIRLVAGQAALVGRRTPKQAGQAILRFHVPHTSNEDRLSRLKCFRYFIGNSAPPNWIAAAWICHVRLAV
jgi:hypothetical protein